MKKSSIYISIILLICFIIWSYLVVSGKLVMVNNQIYNLIHVNLASEQALMFFKIITFLGDAYTLILICILFFKRKMLMVSLIINLVLILIINLVLKNIFMIDRPDNINLIFESGFSYPSGHAMASLAFYGLIIYFIWKELKNRMLKFVLIFMVILIITLIGLSRIYLGVHYFSDIIGGFIISLAYLLMYIEIIKKLGLVSKNEI